MHLYYHDVNDAFAELVVGIHSGSIPTVRSASRNGDVLVVEEPVIITYRYPRQRVLFNAARDCNPFFHLFESLWMLAGRNDITPLVYYNPRMAEYSDDGKTMHGAYGHRWRCCERSFYQESFDQVREIVHQLSVESTSRRCVLSMWIPLEDLWKITKDKPCNTHVYFAVDDGRCLDMTVCNRSNDLIWGMLGANMVHMSLLQEYMACCIGVKVGRYHQMTNNMHVYVDKWDPDKWLESSTHRTIHSPPLINYGSRVRVGPFLVEKPERFDRECKAFVESIDGTFGEPFLRDVAQPMMAAFRAHKQRKYVGDLNAFTLIDRVHAEDWRIVGKQWLTKRQKAWNDRSCNPYTDREGERQEKGM